VVAHLGITLALSCRLPCHLGGGKGERERQEVKGRERGGKGWERERERGREGGERGEGGREEGKVLLNVM